MQADAAGTPQSQDGAEVEACRLWLLIVWGSRFCVGFRNASAGDIQPQVPQKRPEPKIRDQSGSISSREGSGPGNMEGLLGTWMIREIERSHLPVPPET